VARYLENPVREVARRYHRDDTIRISTTAIVLKAVYEAHSALIKSENV